MEYYFYTFGVIGNILFFIYLLGRSGAVLTPIGIHYLFTGQLGFYGDLNKEKLLISLYYLFVSFLVTSTLGREILFCKAPLILGAITASSLIIQLVLYQFFESIMDNPYNFIKPIIRFYKRTFSENFIFHSEIVVKKILVESETQNNFQLLDKVNEIKETNTLMITKVDEIISHTSQISEVNSAIKSFQKTNEQTSIDNDIFMIKQGVKFSFKSDSIDDLGEIMYGYKIEKESKDSLIFLFKENKFTEKILFKCTHKNKWVHANKICYFFLKYTDLFEQKSKSNIKISNKDIYETINRFVIGYDGSNWIENPIKPDAFGRFLKKI